jgi:hypothetical protein
MALRLGHFGQTVHVDVGQTSHAVACQTQYLSDWMTVGIGEDPRFTPRVHQQALTTGPLGNTCEADATSPEVDMGGLQDRDVYN